MPVADTLLGFHASFVLLILGAAGAWCIHGTTFPMVEALHAVAAWKYCSSIGFLGNPKCLQVNVADYGVQACCNQHAFIVVLDCILCAQ